MKALSAGKKRQLQIFQRREAEQNQYLRKAMIAVSKRLGENEAEIAALRVRLQLCGEAISNTFSSVKSAPSCSTAQLLSYSSFSYACKKLELVDDEKLNRLITARSSLLEQGRAIQELLLAGDRRVELVNQTILQDRKLTVASKRSLELLEIEESLNSRRPQQKELYE